MKKLLLILGSIPTLNHLYSQVVFCPPGAEWHYLFQNGPPGWISHVNETVKYVGDSILGADTLKVLTHKRFFHCYGSGPTFIKQKGDTIFMRNKHTYDKWQVLYNFAAQPGHTWKDSLKDPMDSSPYVYTTTVSAVGQTTINGFTLKKLTVNTGRKGGGTYVHEITERIGSNFFMFYFVFPNGFETGFYSTLCYQDDTFGLKQFASNACDFNTTGVEELKFENELEIFPNPATGVINIKLPENRSDLKLYIMDVTGRCIKNWSVGESKTSLDLSDLNSGIYFLQVYDSGNLVSNQKVVKE